MCYISSLSVPFRTAASIHRTTSRVQCPLKPSSCGFRLDPIQAHKDQPYVGCCSTSHLTQRNSSTPHLLRIKISCQGQTSCTIAGGVRFLMCRRILNCLFFFCWVMLRIICSSWNVINMKQGFWCTVLIHKHWRSSPFQNCEDLQACSSSVADRWTG